ncbi:MAG: site-2 protease family protein [Acidobacteriota bacterium]
MSDPASSTLNFCAACGQPLPAGVLSCPACHQLVHSARLEELTQLAKAKQAAGELGPAREAWTEALTLLPPDSKQAAYVNERVETLGRAVHAPAYSGEAQQKKEQPAWVKRLGPFSGIASLLLVAFGKLKFLIFGLTKLKTLATMLVSFGFYWELYGWRFAAGFILGIYIHEMGHVWSLRHFGLRASMPMFIPGLGALVSLYDSPRDAREDARIGLAGPLWGAGAGIAFLLIAFVPAVPGGQGIWLALARATALINLFNLTPIWQLDGGRGFRALDYKQRLLIGALLLLLWWFTDGGLLLILLAGAAYRIFWTKDHAEEGDPIAFMQFVGLISLFGVMMAAIPVRQ